MHELDYAFQDEHSRILRTVVDSSIYMALGTADAQGHPWVSPIFFSTNDYVHFYWVSSRRDPGLNAVRTAGVRWAFF